MQRRRGTGGEGGNGQEGVGGMRGDNDGGVGKQEQTPDDKVL